MIANVLGYALTDRYKDLAPMAPEKDDDGQSPPATPETLSLPKCPEERKNLPPRKQQYFTFEQVQERAHAARSRAAKVPGWLSVLPTDHFLG
jgi:hypothetical protein